MIQALTKEVPKLAAQAPSEIEQAAQGMEAMFLDLMMKTMRSAGESDALGLESQGAKVFRSMLDSEYAQTAARQGGIGLAQQIVEYLERTSYPEGRPINHFQKETSP